MESKARSARGARGLEGAYYTSADIFEVETERIFNRQWLYAGRSAALAEAGDYMTVTVEGEALLLVRGTGGGIKAFFNSCRHRGTQLCSESKGHLGSSIQCPYHAWTYGLDGHLMVAPNMGEAGDFDRANFPLMEVSVGEWEGFAFVSFSPEPRALEQVMEPLTERLAHRVLGQLEVAHRVEYDIQANWKLLVQNYSECYHCPKLHPVLNQLTPYRNSTNDLEEGPILGGPMRMSIEGGSMTMSGNRCAVPLTGVEGEDLNLVYYYTLFPNMFLSLAPDYVLVHQLLRQSPGRTLLNCDWLAAPAAASDPDVDFSGAVEFWAMTNEQDWRICEASQVGVGARSYTPGPYADLESMVASSDRHYLQRLGHHLSGAGLD